MEKEEGKALCRFRKALKEEGNIYAEVCAVGKEGCSVCGGEGWVYAYSVGPKTIYRGVFMCECLFKKLTEEWAEGFQKVLDSPYEDRKSKKAAKNMLEKIRSGEVRVWNHPTFQEYLEGYRVVNGKLVQAADPVPPETASRCKCEREYTQTKIEFNFIWREKGPEMLKKWEEETRRAFKAFDENRAQKKKEVIPIFTGIFEEEKPKKKQRKEVKDADVKRKVPART